MGAPVYVHDLDLPGMLHARVVRPPGPGMRLAALDAGEVEAHAGRGRRSCATAVSSASSRSARSRRYAPRAGSRASRSGRAAASCPGADPRYLLELGAEDEVDQRKGRGAAGGESGVRACSAEYSAPAHRARLARPVVRGRAIHGRALQRVDAQPGDLPAARATSPAALGVAESDDRDRAHGRRRLLRPQRRGRRRLRRGAARARGAGAPGPRAMDARRRVRLGALRLADGGAHASGARRRRAHRELEPRPVEPRPQHAPGRQRRGEPARRRGISTSR